MRKKKHPEHVNHERWLVSYADFITLLFAFFVVMFAVSQVDSKKVGRFTEAFSKAVGIEVFPLSGSGLLAGTDLVVAGEGTGKETGLLPSALDGLKDALDQARKSGGPLGGLQIIRRRNEIVLRLPEQVLFDSGDDGVKPQVIAMLKALALEIKPRDLEVRVEGHTDDRPISTARFPSNWELSCARATAVVLKLASEGGLPWDRLSAAGYGEYRPIATNGTEDGRRQNRRVDIVVTPAAIPAPSTSASSGAPPASAPPASAPPKEHH